jgi:hypothetical protein
VSVALIAHHESHRLKPLAGPMAAHRAHAAVDRPAPPDGAAPGQLSTPVIRPTLLNRVRPVELLQQQQAG